MHRFFSFRFCSPEHDKFFMNSGFRYSPCTCAKKGRGNIPTGLEEWVKGQHLGKRSTHSSEVCMGTEGASGFLCGVGTGCCCCCVGAWDRGRCACCCSCCCCVCWFCCWYCCCCRWGWTGTIVGFLPGTGGLGGPGTYTTIVTFAWRVWVHVMISVGPFSLNDVIPPFSVWQDLPFHTQHCKAEGGTLWTTQSYMQACVI